MRGSSLAPVVCVACALVLLVARNACAGVPESMPDGWTPLHWEAFAGSSERVEELLSHGHDANELTDNEVRIRAARKARSAALRQTNEALWQAAQPRKSSVESPSQFNQRYSRWRKSKLRYRRSWHAARVVKGSYLVVEGLVHSVDLETVGLAIVARGRYEDCLGRRLRRSFCTGMLADPTLRPGSLTIPALYGSASGDLALTVGAMLASAQLSRHMRCGLARSRESACRAYDPPRPVGWENFDPFEDSLTLDRPTPVGALALVLADHDLRVAFRNHRATALHLAAASGDAGKVRHLLQSGASPRDQADDGSTPLHRAAAVDAVASLRAMIEAGADLDAGNVRGYTALHVAVAHRARRSAVTLLAGGADPHAEGSRGETPLWLAMLWGDEGWILQQTLQRHGARCGKLCQLKEPPVFVKRKSVQGPIHIPIE